MATQEKKLERRTETSSGSDSTLLFPLSLMIMGGIYGAVTLYKAGASDPTTITEENTIGGETPERFFYDRPEFKKERFYVSIDGMSIPDKFKTLGVNIDPDNTRSESIRFGRNGKIAQHTGYSAINGRRVESYFQKTPRRTGK